MLKFTILCCRFNFEPGSNLILAGTIQFASSIQLAKQQLAADFPSLVIPQSKPLSPGALPGKAATSCSEPPPPLPPQSPGPPRPPSPPCSGAHASMLHFCTFHQVTLSPVSLLSLLHFLFHWHLALQPVVGAQGYAALGQPACIQPCSGRCIALISASAVVHAGILLSAIPWSLSCS